MLQECFVCHQKTVDHLIEKHKPAKEHSELFSEKSKQLLKENQHLNNPELATQLHRLAKKHLQNRDLYLEEKLRANDILLQKYGFWKKLVADSDDPFATAVRMAVAGNIIDYGAHTVPEDLEAYIQQLLQKELAIDATEDLEKKLSSAQSVLYIGDNAGEIVFDKLLIETIRHPNMTFAVRGKPILNDATLTEAEQVKMADVVTVISNGNDAPSTLLEYCSEEFLALFNSADLIISKGQGNFEGLMNTQKDNIFFLLMAKCKPIAQMLNVQPRDMLVVRSPLG